MRAGTSTGTPASGYPGKLPYEVGCQTFTRELRRVQWPSSRTFKPEIPEKYDGKTHPLEFLSIYTIAVQDDGGRNEKILANYFLLVLKPNVRSWLMYLPKNSEIYGAPGEESDLHIIPQKEGESLPKYIQRFSRIPPVAVIGAFHQNVRNPNMREELVVKQVRDVPEIYAVVDRCTRAEEGRRLPSENAGVEDDFKDEDVDVPTKRERRRNEKRNGKTVFSVEAVGDADSAKKAKDETSGNDAAGCGSCHALAAADKPNGSGAQYCKIHPTNGHNFQHSWQVEQLAEKQKAEYQRRDKEKAWQGGEGSGGKKGAQGCCPGKFKVKKARHAQPREKMEEDDDEDSPDDYSSHHEFQRATDMMCLEGGASIHYSHRQLKKWAREVIVAERSIGVHKPMKWSQTPIIFDSEDNPHRVTAVGCVPLLVLPMIRNLRVTKMLVDGGAGLNLIYPDMIRKL